LKLIGISPGCCYTWNYWFCSATYCR